MKRIIIVIVLSLVSVSVFSQIGIVINEFMASNSTFIQDENGEFDDWIELYNTTSSALNIGGMYFTDDLTNTTLFQIPAGNDSTIIPAHGFLLLWADKDPEQGVLHLNLKLSETGEQIGIYTLTGIVVDTLTFGLQINNVSFGRLPNGSSTWQSMYNPTPGASNTATFITVSDGFLTVSSAAISTGTFSVFSNASWTAASNQTWLTVAPQNGNDTTLITVTAAQNTSASQRTATVTISATGASSQDVIVTQLGNSPMLTASIDTIIIDNLSNSTGSFDITSNISWTINNTASWLSVNPLSGTGMTNVMVTANSQNPTSAIRNTTLTLSGTGVSDVNIEIIQEGSFEIPQLTINEFLTSNDSLNADNFGEYEDWIEIYNKGNTAVDLAGMYITDDLTNTNKFQFDAGNDSTIIPAHGFLLLYADEDGSQGVLHLNFKLSVFGESIGLYNEGLDLIDFINFNEQDTNISFGRYPDGSNTWVSFVTPTPGSTNILGIENAANENFSVSPNPAKNNVSIQFKNTGIKLCEIKDMTGKQIVKFSTDKQQYNLACSKIPSGTYILTVTQKSEKTSLKIVIE